MIAVPTSTGYGAALDGITALLAMMTSCAAGVCVVNIDSGFGAAMAAHRLAFSMRRRAVGPPAGRTGCAAGPGEAPVILWLNPFSGISGDMLLGALLDLGAPLDAVRAAVASTGITGWELTAGPVQRAGLAACQARVRVQDDVPARRAAELLTLARAAVPAAAGRLAAAAITALAEAEGRIHGVPAAEVHLHELGGVDTIVDTVGVAAALDALRVSAVWSAPLTLGAGVIEMRHGQFPAPAPATVALLDGAAVTGTLAGLGGRAAETVTPTGAALLRAAGCRYGPVPAMRVAGSGYGAGTRDVPGRPNVLPALLGEPLGDEGAEGRTGRTALRP